MNISALGIDLAKNIFYIHGIDKTGKTVLKKKILRGQLASFIAQIPPCLIGMEACGSAHYWARQFQPYGHTVKRKKRCQVLTIDTKKEKVSSLDD